MTQGEKRPIINRTTGARYDSISEAAREENVSASTIYRALKSEALKGMTLEDDKENS